MKTTLVLVRHGETKTNVAGKLHKAQDANALTNTGKNQITKTAEELLKYKPFVLFSSKEIRAIESAKIISKICQIKNQAITGFQERNWGDFSGKSFSDIADEVLNKLTIEERYTYVPPNGESWKSFITRLKQSIENLINKYKGKTIIIVTHGGAIRASLPYLLDIPKEESFNFDPTNASLTIFEHDGKKFTEKTINDTSHLKID